MTHWCCCGGDESKSCGVWRDRPYNPGQHSENCFCRKCGERRQLLSHIEAQP